jgi:ATP-dependent Lon protease
MSETESNRLADYSPEIVEQAESHPALGAEYFAARDQAERFMAHWKEEHAEKLAEEIMKPIMDTIQERVWDSFRDFLLSDTVSNVQNEMQRMVEKSVRALIGGQKWANVKYIEYPYDEGKKVRETLAKLHSDPIKDGRIADLEKEIERLTDQLRWARGSN